MCCKQPAASMHGACSTLHDRTLHSATLPTPSTHPPAKAIHRAVVVIAAGQVGALRCSKGQRAHRRRCGGEARAGGAASWEVWAVRFTACTAGDNAHRCGAAAAATAAGGWVAGGPGGGLAAAAQLEAAAAAGHQAPPRRPCHSWVGRRRRCAAVAAAGIWHRHRARICRTRQQILLLLPPLLHLCTALNHQALGGAGAGIRRQQAKGQHKLVGLVAPGPTGAVQGQRCGSLHLSSSNGVAKQHATCAGEREMQLSCGHVPQQQAGLPAQQRQC